MKRTLLILSAILCALGSGCAEKPMPGGYAKASVTDKNVLAAARFAITAQSDAIRQAKDRPQTTLELLSVITAEQQVVAGANYHLILSVKENGNPRTADVVVWWQAWRKPDPYRLTSWTWK